MKTDTGSVPWPTVTARGVTVMRIVWSVAGGNASSLRERERVLVPGRGCREQLGEPGVVGAAEAALDGQLDGLAEERDVDLDGQRGATVGLVLAAVVGERQVE